MYRSFLTCDDPKGVVECGTIRKYRTCSHKRKDMIIIQKTAENLETSLMNKRYKAGKFSKGTDVNLIGPSSLQPTQISVGDQSLNSMIDSWSRDLMYEGKSEDIAKDTLKGALDLQDSLIMLRKLQEASRHNTPFRRKQTERPTRDRIDANMICRTQANPFSEQSNPKGFQRLQPCAGGSSSNCNKELKKMIKENLVRQILYPRPSQSSMVRTERLFDHSFSVIASKMERGPGLVVKLMGLEEAPSRSFPPVMRKQLDGENILKQKRPVCETDMSKVRKKDSMDEKVNPEQKILRETLDTMHFKGLLNKSVVKEPKLLQVHYSNDPNSKQCDDLSHAVLTKPPCFLYQESVKTHKPVPPEELSMRKLKAEIISSRRVKHIKVSSSTSMGKELAKGVRKQLSKEEGPKFLKGVMKVDAKGINPFEESSRKVKLYCHFGHTSQVNETIDKKWKVQTISRKQPEKGTSELRIVTRPQYQPEITSSKLRKQKSRSRIDKNEISCLKNAGSNNFSISETESQKTNNSKDHYIEMKNFDYVADSSTRRKNQMSNPNPVVEPEPPTLTVEQIRHGEEKKCIDVPGKDDYTKIRITNTLADELLMVCEADACANKIGGCKQSMNCSGDDIMLLKSEHENDSIHAEEADEVTNCSEADSINPDIEGAKLKHFLLTSQSFIGHAERLFNLDVDSCKNPQKDETNYGITGLRLYLDCANELIERKSLQESHVIHSFMQASTGNSRIHISLGRLVEEIYDAIENLKFYRENYGEKHFEDNVFAMMEKDKKCNGMMNSTWDQGWRHGFSADEAELVVNKIESLLFSGLIEEVIINL